MKLFMENLSDAAALVTGTSYWSTEFPAANVQTPRGSEQGKSDTVTSGFSISFDFGAAVTPEALLIAFHDLADAPALDSIFLYGGTSPGAPDVVLFDLTAAIATGTIFSELATLTPSSGTYGPARYWSMTFAKASSSDQKSIGRIYLGPIIEPSDLGLPDYNGVTETIRDRSEAEESINGEEYIEAKSQVRSWALDFSEIPEADMADIVARYRVVGKHTPFFMQISDVAPLNELIYVRFTMDLGRKVASYDSAFNWDTASAVKEFI